jgi:hypothetical protein
MSYFVSPPEETEWRISPEALGREILARWPDAELEHVDRPASLHAISWTLRQGSHRLDGTLTKDGQVVHLEGDVCAAAAFAAWFRSKVPVDQPLIFYDDGYSADVALSPDIAEEEIYGPFIDS